MQFYVGEVLYNRGLNDEALNALKRSIELAPDNPDAHYLLGFVLGDMGRHDEAQKATKRAIQLNPALSRARTCRWTGVRPHAYESVAAQRAGRAVDRGWRVAPAGSSRTSTSDSPFGRRATTREALVSTVWPLNAVRTAGMLRAMAGSAPAQKEPAMAAQLYEKLLASRPDSPKLWNERGIAAPGRRYADAAGSYRQA